MTDWEKEFDEKFGKNYEVEQEDGPIYMHRGLNASCQLSDVIQFIKDLLKEEREKSYNKAIDRVSKNLAGKGYITYKELKKLQETNDNS